MSGRTALGVALVAGAYLLGSIPFGLLVSRAAAGVDVREVGSGNIGATNVARAAGRWAALLTLVLDVSKAAAPALLAGRLLGPGAAGWAAAAGLAAFLGHVFPAYLGFRGGKGVAAGLGVLLALSPWAALAAAGTWGAAVAATRMVSVGSLAGAAVGAGVALALHGGRSPASWAALAVAAVVFARHRSNIERIRRGREPRL